MSKSKSKSVGLILWGPWTVITQQTQLEKRSNITQTIDNHAVKKMANISKNPSLCLINISVDRPLRVVMMSTLIFCWSVEKNTPRVNDPEVRGLIRDVHVSWSQRTPCLSWLPDWPLSVSAVWALFQESLKKHDKIIPRSSPTDVSYMQPSASSAEPCTTLQLHPETANCTIRANWYVPGKKKKRVMMSILGTLNPYQMAGRGNYITVDYHRRQKQPPVWANVQQYSFTRISGC